MGNAPCIPIAARCQQLLLNTGAKAATYFLEGCQAGDYMGETPNLI